LSCGSLAFSGHFFLCFFQEGRSCAIFYFYYKNKYKIMAYLALSLSKFEARVVRKVTTRTTGLWLLSVHSDVVFFAMLMML
jgi:hypothetical protein